MGNIVIGEGGNRSGYFDGFTRFRILEDRLSVCLSASLHLPLTVAYTVRRILCMFHIQEFVRHTPMLENSFYYKSVIYGDHQYYCRSQWQRDLRHEVSSPSETLRVVGTNPTWGTCLCFSMFVFSCVGNGLEMDWSPVQGVLLTAYKSKKLRETKRFTDALCSRRSKSKSERIKNSVALVRKRTIPTDRPSDCRLYAKLVPNLEDKECRVVSATNPHGR
jgi:hypothetical protein